MSLDFLLLVLAAIGAIAFAVGKYSATTYATGLGRCPACATLASTTAHACPSCGHRLRSSSAMAWVMAAVAALVALWILAMVFGI